MRLLLPAHPVLFLIGFLGAAGAPLSACGLEHCPRPDLRSREYPSLGWTLAHTDLSRDGLEGRFTQGAFHLRYPMGTHFALGGHLPFGYLRGSADGHWGLANPMAYAEGAARPSPAHTLTAGLQVEMPFGDSHSGIASEHSMAMPYASYAFRTRRIATLVSTGFSAQLPGGHSHGGTDAHAGHAGYEGPAERALEANPHEPYEVLWRAGISAPVEALRIEPEAYLYGARVAFGDGVAEDPMVAGAALTVRLGRALQVKPRWERPLAGTPRFAWTTALEVRYALAH
jgi:hypothetical protein